MDIIQQLEEIIRIAEETFSYEKVFDLTGISDVLKEKYITTDILNKAYVSIFINIIKKFKNKNNLYKDLSLNVEKDLVFLSENEEFKKEVKIAIDKIKKKLEPREQKLLEYLDNFGSEEDVKIVDLIYTLKMDKTSVLFILDNLKEKNAIYAYNGKEVSLN